MSFLSRLIITDLRKCADTSYTKSVLSNTGRAAVYESSVVLSLPFCYRLNRNWLESWSRAVVSNLTDWRFHPSALNKAVSRSYCEAVGLLWPFVCVTCIDIVPSLKWWWLQAAYRWAFCPWLSTNRLRLGTTASNQLRSTMTVWKRCVRRVGKGWYV